MTYIDDKPDTRQLEEKNVDYDDVEVQRVDMKKVIRKV